MEASRAVPPTAAARPFLHVEPVRNGALEEERRRILDWLARYGPAALDAIPHRRPLGAVQVRAVVRGLIRDGRIASVPPAAPGEAPRLALGRIGRLELGAEGASTEGGR